VWKLNFRDAVFIADSPYISLESAGIRKGLLLEFFEPARGPKPHGIIWWNGARSSKSVSSFMTLTSV